MAQNQSGTAAIPKIIHQTWKTRDIPVEWQEWAQSWKHFHPDWQHQLWTDEDNNRFVEEHYPDFLESYEGYSYDIQRADAIRYLILHKYGGIYVDLDFECLRSFDGLVTGRSFIMGREPEKHARWHGEGNLVSNAFMASLPGHPFLLEVISAMKQMNPSITFHREVLKTTGPIMLTRVMRNYTADDLFIVNDNVLYPFTSDSAELDQVVNKKENSSALIEMCRKKGSYAIHYWANTWVRNLAGPLVNPNPNHVKDYRFYSGFDSLGYDIGNVGRDINKLVTECNRNRNAAGFNTDGFMKYRIRPRFRWIAIDNEEGNEGLYVKKGWRARFQAYTQFLVSLFHFQFS